MSRRHDGLIGFFKDLPFVLFIVSAVATILTFSILTIRWFVDSLWIFLLVLVLFLPGCTSFGLTPGYREKHPDLLENTRHFYSEPLNCCRRYRCSRGIH
jgi:hypothetical protein